MSIGMCKDLIMSPEDKVLKRQKIEENRAKKRGIRGFKAGFKKIKRESFDGDSQGSEGSNYSGVLCIDAEGAKEQGSIDLNRVSPEERVVSSSDDVSMIRTILGDSRPPQDNGNDPLINNNDMNCNNNPASSTSKSRLAQDVTKDVVEDVHRYDKNIFCPRAFRRI